MASVVPTWLRVPAGVPWLRRGRHVWTGDGRLHVEVRALDPDQLESFAARVRAVLEDTPGIDWAELNQFTHRLVVSHGPDGPSPADVIRTIEAVEVELGVERVGFRTDLPDHPGDDTALVRQLVGLGADLTGLGLGLARRMARVAPRAAVVDVAALVAVAENVPRFRQVMDRRYGWPLADLGLEVAGAISGGLAQGPLGPLIDVVHRSATVAETLARRRAWERREPELCAKPSPPAGLEVGPLSARPAPVPAGPVERYAERAWPLSLAAFGVALPLTRSLERSVPALTAGLPKAARLGREAFAVHLGRGLAGWGVVVLDPRPLRVLDRVDTLVIESRVTATDSSVLVAAADRAELSAEVCGPDDDFAATIRRLQAEGGVVLAVASTPTAALAAADCAVGIARAGDPAPWAAHLLCDDAIDAAGVVGACGAAREASRQGATLSLAGAGVGGLVAFGGLLPGTSVRVMTAVNLASLAAVANGTRCALGALHRPELPVAGDATPWHALGRAEVLDLLGSSREGLDPDEIAVRRDDPPLPDPPVVRVARAVGGELVNPLTPILAGGAGLSAAVGSVLDAVMVAGVMGMNAVIGGVQRFRTDQAIEALRGTSVQQVTARRAGTETRVAASGLVAGDVIRLEAGEMVPADCRILDAHGVEVDESTLTGESLPVAKSAARTEATAVAERTSMLYAGTSIAAGKCWAVVVAVGDATEARRGLSLDPGGAPETGVEARLRSLTDLTVPVAAGSGAAIVALGLLRGRSLLDVASAGVSLTVAAVPEGLPLLATVAQLSAAKRLSARGALMRNPRAIEALGRVDVLCADKTGTLTEARIRVGRIDDGVEDHDVAALGDSTRAVLAAALRATPRSDTGRRLPHPTDRALGYAEEATGVDPADGAEGWEQQAELPFEPGRGYHAVLARTASGQRLSAKGAPEVLLPLCTTRAHPDGRARRLDSRVRRRLAARVEALARRGFRVLVVAERDLCDAAALADEHVTALRFVGLVCLTDPVRPTAAAAVAEIRRAGIAVVMITGDHPSTAEGIAAELGLLDGDRVITGAELDSYSDDELDALLPAVSVFARVTPAHKVRIVRAYQRAGRVVAMTGDGANDAPAIRLADVGIALGSRSTAAARDAADLVVADDRIETIVDAIVEGRGMWGSVRDAVALLVGSNLGEIGFTVAGTVLGGAPPVNARQLLLVNLLTDIAPALSIALRPPRGATPETLLREGPDASLGSSLTRAITMRAVITGTTSTGAWIAARLTGTPGHARTVGLAALVGTQLGQTLAVGGRDPLVLAAGLGSAALLAAVIQTPGASQLFGCQPLGALGWGIALSAASAGTAAAVLAPRLVPALAPAR